MEYGTNVTVNKEKETAPVLAPGEAKMSSPTSKFMKSIIAEDMASVGSYVLNDVIVPSVKDAINDIVTKGIAMLLYGDTTAPKNAKKGAYVSGTRFAYNSISSRSANKKTESSEAPSSYEDIEYSSHEAANKVLQFMISAIEEYDTVSIYQYYKEAGFNPPYTLKEWGWDNLSKAYIRHIGRDKYIIVLPKPIRIEA